MRGAGNKKESPCRELWGREAMKISELTESIVGRIYRPDRLNRIGRALTRVNNIINTRIRELEANPAPGRDYLQPSIRKKRTPWSGIITPECDIPGMITSEECQYYSYIGQFYKGAGEVVELGPWLGRSTFYILHGLERNPRFTRKLHVYDDFTWRSDWMDDKVPENERYPHHADFMPLFGKYTQSFRDKINVHKRKIVTYDGNDNIEQLTWDGKPIEIMYIDCGRTFAANEAWWAVFKDSFIPGKTLIILEDWNTHSEVPVKWYNQLHQWVESHKDSMHLVHELRNGGIAMFVYSDRQQ